MKLAAWLARPEAPPDNVFADRIGVARVTLFRFKRGDRIPARPVMARIVTATSGEVGPADFYDAANKSPQPSVSAA